MQVELETCSKFLITWAVHTLISSTNQSQRKQAQHYLHEQIEHKSLETIAVGLQMLENQEQTPSFYGYLVLKQIINEINARKLPSCLWGDLSALYRRVWSENQKNNVLLLLKDYFYRPGSCHKNQVSKRILGEVLDTQLLQVDPHALEILCHIFLTKEQSKCMRMGYGRMQMQIYRLITKAHEQPPPHIQHKLWCRTMVALAKFSSFQPSTNFIIKGLTTYYQDTTLFLQILELYNKSRIMIDNVEFMIKFNLYKLLVNSILTIYESIQFSTQIIIIFTAIEKTLRQLLSQFEMCVKVYTGYTPLDHISHPDNPESPIVRHLALNTEFFVSQLALLTHISYTVRSQLSFTENRLLNNIVMLLLKYNPQSDDQQFLMQWLPTFLNKQTNELKTHQLLCILSIGSRQLLTLLNASLILQETILAVRHFEQISIDLLCFINHFVNLQVYIERQGLLQTIQNFLNSILGSHTHPHNIDGSYKQVTEGHNQQVNKAHKIKSLAIHTLCLTEKYHPHRCQQQLHEHLMRIVRETMTVIVQLFEDSETSIIDEIVQILFESFDELCRFNRYDKIVHRVVFENIDKILQYTDQRSIQTTPINKYALHFLNYFIQFLCQMSSDQHIEQQVTIVRKICSFVFADMKCSSQRQKQILIAPTISLLNKAVKNLNKAGNHLNTLWQLETELNLLRVLLDPAWISTLSFNEQHQILRCITKITLQFCIHKMYSEQIYKQVNALHLAAQGDLHQSFQLVMEVLAILYDYTFEQQTGFADRLHLIRSMHVQKMMSKLQLEFQAEDGDISQSDCLYKWSKLLLVRRNVDKDSMVNLVVDNKLEELNNL